MPESETFRIESLMGGLPSPHKCHFMQQGWVCPKCGTVNAPWVVRCMGCPKTGPTLPNTPTYKQDCGCPEIHVCMVADCPRRVQITCSSE